MVCMFHQFVRHHLGKLALRKLCYGFLLMKQQYGNLHKHRMFHQHCRFHQYHIYMEYIIYHQYEENNILGILSKIHLPLTYFFLGILFMRILMLLHPMNDKLDKLCINH